MPKLIHSRWFYDVRDELQLRGYAPGEACAGLFSEWCGHGLRIEIRSEHRLRIRLPNGQDNMVSAKTLNDAVRIISTAEQDAKKLRAW